MNSPRILVIDDSPSVCHFVSTALRQVGYEVSVALNGQDGLAKIMAFRPHCLILDVLLPDTSGYALCRRLRENPLTRNLSLILISTKNGALDINYGLRQGANRYLPKPFTGEALIQNVRDVVPEPFRSSAHMATPHAAPSSFQPRRTLSTLLQLIPRRVLSEDAMQTSNPLASALMVKDKQARRVYTQIDGKKSITRLVALTGLEAEEVIKALRMLLQAKYIALYDETGQRVEDAL